MAHKGNPPDPRVRRQSARRHIGSHQPAKIDQGPDGRSWLRIALYALRVASAVLLAVDAYVHASDASFYDAPRGGAITMGNLFRIEAGTAGLVALLLLVGWRSRISWLPAFLVAASAIGGVVLYRYIDVGILGPIPNMYEPTWQVPGKLLSAYAEGAAVVLSALGFLLSTSPMVARIRPTQGPVTR